MQSYSIKLITKPGVGTLLQALESEQNRWLHDNEWLEDRRDEVLHILGPIHAD